ncbi:hypothetical protein BDR26DRAFT_923023 [Obelidium mucronatum]|nr:hypothetical protein BDR26DRAFT_923023 [Obelidium mucronatum]
MINPLFFLLAITSAISSVTALANPPINDDKVVGGYLLLNPKTGPAKLEALADNAANIPVNRVFLSFVSPTMIYVPNSKTLKYADIGYSSTGDHGFAAVKAAVAKLQAGGVEVFLSMGGWNYNCFPHFYMKYSIAHFGKGPNYWKITKYGGGSASGCNASNMWCYVCEPESEGTTLKDFTIFPEPAGHATWKAAQKMIEAGAKGEPVKWHPEFVGGATVKDKDGVAVKVPGSSLWKRKKRNPYKDFVSLAKDLGLDGIDIDYEEMWHADAFRSGTGMGPFKLDQTVYKYTAIVYDVMNNIKKIYPTCKLGTAAGAAGAWETKWWGGNLKGVWYYANLWYPDAIKFMSTGANAGGINVMTYDLSKNNNFFECPSGSTADCDLAGQVKFYMDTYAKAGINARVGYEIGQPAYPDPTNDPENQIPLTQAGLDGILSDVKTSSTNGGFFWELYKPKTSPQTESQQKSNIDANTVAQKVCKKVLGADKRCSGVIPQPKA